MRIDNHVKKIVGRKNSFYFADKFKSSFSKNLRGCSTTCPLISDFNSL